MLKCTAMSCHVIAPVLYDFIRICRNGNRQQSPGLATAELEYIAMMAVMPAYGTLFVVSTLLYLTVRCFRRNLFDESPNTDTVRTLRFSQGMKWDPHCRKAFRSSSPTYLRPATPCLIIASTGTSWLEGTARKWGVHWGIRACSDADKNADVLGSGTGLVRHKTRSKVLRSRAGKYNSAFLHLSWLDPRSPFLTLSVHNVATT
jgi:hypothetical protein